MPIILYTFLGAAYRLTLGYHSGSPSTLTTFIMHILLLHLTIYTLFCLRIFQKL
jgi:hypothetical protein